MSFQKERELPSFWSSDPLPMPERNKKSLRESACNTRYTTTAPPSMVKYMR